MALLALAPAASALEIWLAHTPECNSCELFERAAERRHYGEALHYSTGSGELVIPIQEVPKDELSASILRQFPDGTGPGDPDWRIKLTVLVVDDGHVLAAGNIASSADNRQLRHSYAVMFPPAAPPPDHPALTHHELYAPFFVSHWNLEYFVDVALDKRAPREAAALVDLASPDPWPAGPANVVLWGSAGTPLANALFISERIAEIRAQLDRLGLDETHFVTLYGNGPDVAGNDTSYIANGRTLFKEADLPADLPATGEALNRVLTGIREAPASRSLLIQVGHSGPAGSPLWGSGLTLAPADLAPFADESGARIVMVSGACNSGLFARAVQCGFFAAHPEVIATGCQLSPEALRTSDDYLRYFFRAATGVPERPPASLDAAHWYASTRLEDHQISYTTSDALIDEYFAQHPDNLPAELTVGEIREAGRGLPPAEAQALAALTANLPGTLPIPLTGYVALNHAAQDKLADARELSSAERNRITAMP
ncbi:MAG TPA: hypothetical protein VFG91_02475, partial [Woeseiaceae bacterium]|nr:hypothetical protein [Woeseiaceae bacterium]